MERNELAERVAVHALTWLVVGNAVGLLLATLLLAPRLNDSLAPLTYGRWVPVHLDVLLYGWCTFPLIGLLLHYYLPISEGGVFRGSTDSGGSGDRTSVGDLRWTARQNRWSQLTLGISSGAVGLGAATWLSGQASGKPFLDWAGPARWLLVAALSWLWVVLAAGWYRRWRAGEDRPGVPRLARALLLAVLAAVPGLLAWASGPGVYPPINPETGGATGGSLLGSSLAVVAMMWGFPWIVGRRPRGDLATARRVSDQTLALLVLHFALFALLDHGDHSHHEAVQIVALASLLIWPPLLARHLRRFFWPREMRPWLAALAAWGGLLVASAFVTFLPGVLERWKFTDALVAHAHLAMAAMATSFLVPVLMGLGNVESEPPLGDVFARRLPFVLWHGGCLLYVVSMTIAGHLEGGDPALLFTTPPALTTLYAARWLAGAAMLAASAAWLGGALRQLARVEAAERENAIARLPTAVGQGGKAAAGASLPPPRRPAPPGGRGSSSSPVSPTPAPACC